MRGKKFDLNLIKYDAIREWFEKNETETVSSFSQKVFATEYQGGERSQLMANFIADRHEVFFTVKQIRRMCEVIGKPFEEVFKESESVFWA